MTSMRLARATTSPCAALISPTAKALQGMAEDQLYEEAAQRVRHAMSQGVGAMEIKSGYGLTLEAERKMLRVVARLKEAMPIPIRATF